MDLQKAYDTVEWCALESILNELGFPSQFIRWIMICVTTVSYRYMINGTTSQCLQAKRGLRQGDPISPLLFVLVMEYLYRNLQSLRRNPDFNFHAKCENLRIINLSFADDLLFFSRGDTVSVQLLMNQFANFSRATGLKVNPRKCHIYYGAVSDEVKEHINLITGFSEGTFPFRYLGVPLTSRKIAVADCQPLIDKMVARIRHWSAKLLSYAGRIQLIRSVLFAVANYWLQCFPLPKGVLHTVEAICRSFLWSNSESINRKAPVSWEKVCMPKSKGGLQIIALSDWNTACLMKLLWNLCGKQDNLWVKWVHAYYIPQEDVLTATIPRSCSWIIKGILSCRPLTRNNHQWATMLHLPKFQTGIIYRELQGDVPVVPWRSLLYKNYARPRAKFIVWMACHFRLPTRSRLHRFGFVDTADCCFCNQDETQDHLLFNCRTTVAIWQRILNWLQVQHVPHEWSTEMGWILHKIRGRGWRANLLKLAFTETVYETWICRNKACFERSIGPIDVNRFAQGIIDVIVYRAWSIPELKSHVGYLMLE